jgi:hypothetical protein
VWGYLKKDLTDLAGGLELMLIFDVANDLDLEGIDAVLYDQFVANIV